jgi:hypothetical protein
MANQVHNENRMSNRTILLHEQAGRCPFAVPASYLECQPRDWAGRALAGPLVPIATRLGDTRTICGDGHR